MLDQRLVVLPDIPVRAIEQLRILMQFVLEQSFAERDLDLTLARVGVLPTVEANLPDDLVDVINEHNESQPLGSLWWAIGPHIWRMAQLVLDSGNLDHE